MRSNKLLVATMGLFLLAGNTSAGVDELCICQTGDSPREQIPAFIAGCEAWLNLQMCLKKKIVNIEKPLTEVVKSRPRSLKLGFVGHWSSAQESVSFLKSDVVPLVQKFGMRTKVDNTACLAVDNPYLILKYLQSVDVGSKISFKGNQAISTGLWDMFLPGKNNFYSKIDAEKDNVEFPSCTKFEDRVCFGVFQGDGRGVCEDKKTGEHVFLRCEGDETEIIEDGVGKVITRGGIGAMKKLARWKREEAPTFNQMKSFMPGKIHVVSNSGGYFSFDSQEEADKFTEAAKKDVRMILKHSAGMKN